MAISPELEARYTTEVNVDWWEALIISHPLIPTLYMTTHAQEQQGDIDGSTQTFTPVPFSFNWPHSDDSGRGDMGVVIGAVGNGISELIETALGDPTTQIQARFTVYIEGDPEPQYTPPISLALTGINVTEQSITATASHADTLNAPFPRVRYTVTQFPGLNRR